MSERYDEELRHCVEIEELLSPVESGHGEMQMVKTF